MKILHTSDWHIGHIFKDFSRQAEHKMFFSWLKELIISNNVEVLLISGDIFDVANPSSSALKLYYDFLTSLQTSSCKKIIITGGNHDGISTLDAPKEILDSLNITIISGEKDFLMDKKNLIIELKDSNGKFSSIVCAIPFLRDGVVRKSVAGGSYIDNESRLRDGIVSYYKEMLEVALKISDDVPIIAMGHLSVVGGLGSDSEREIYIGKLQSLSDEMFDGYDYVALGHLHRPQIVGSNRHIRYSGSPICLSFSEIGYDKKVLLLDIKDREIKIDEVIVPRFRELFHIKGSLDDVLEKLLEINSSSDLTSWVEVTIENQYITPQIHSLVYEKIKDLDLEVLQINTQNKEKEKKGNLELESLNDITPLKVFEVKCEENRELLDDEIEKKLIESFKEIMELVNEDL